MSHETTLAGDLANLFTGRFKRSPQSAQTESRPMDVLSANTANDKQQYRYAQSWLKEANKEPSQENLMTAHRMVQRLSFTDPHHALGLLYAQKDSKSAALKDQSLAQYMEIVLDEEFVATPQQYSHTLHQVAGLILNHSDGYNVESPVSVNMRRVLTHVAENAIEGHEPGSPAYEAVIDAVVPLLTKPDFIAIASAFLDAHGCDISAAPDRSAVQTVPAASSKFKR